MENSRIINELTPKKKKKYNKQTREKQNGSRKSMQRNKTATGRDNTQTNTQFASDNAARISSSTNRGSTKRMLNPGDKFRASRKSSAATGLNKPTILKSESAQTALRIVHLH